MKTKAPDDSPVYIDGLGATRCRHCTSVLRNAGAEPMVLIRLNDLELIAKWIAMTPTETTRHELFTWIESAPTFLLPRLQEAIGRPVKLL
jgi:hypothetical protein